MSRNGRYLFTSESVTEGHPDKIADQISDSILDAILAQDPVGRVACETLVTTGLAIIAGEITTSCYVDFPKIVRETIKEVGYTRAKFGFDRPQEDEFAMCMLGQPSPYLTIAFPNRPPVCQEYLDMEGVPDSSRRSSGRRSTGVR